MGRKYLVRLRVKNAFGREVTIILPLEEANKITKFLNEEVIPLITRQFDDGTGLRKLGIDEIEERTKAYFTEN